MRNRRLLAQFIHPGGEHEPDHDGHKSWNERQHRRKFLLSPGRYIASGRHQAGEIVFWGEWEPQSRVLRRFEAPVLDGPRFLYQPYYEPPPSWDGIRLQNTDPFVFGEQFHYTACLQHTRQGPTQLRYLDRGSILLFGSCRKRRCFVIDTVFVVDHWLDHSTETYRELYGLVSQTYAEVTIAPWYSATLRPGQSHRLYFGAHPREDRCRDLQLLPVSSRRLGTSRLPKAGNLPARTNYPSPDPGQEDHRDRRRRAGAPPLGRGR